MKTLQRIEHEMEQLRVELYQLRASVSSVPVATTRPSVPLRSMVTNEDADPGQALARNSTEWELADAESADQDRTFGIVLGRLSATSVIVGLPGRHTLWTAPEESWTTYALDPLEPGALVPLASLPSDGSVPLVPVFYHMERGEIEIFGPTTRIPSAASVIITAQEAHGLAEDDWVQLEGGAWEKATQDDETDFVGVVVEVPSSAIVVVAIRGRVPYAGATPSVVYYLGETAGAAVTTRPEREFGEKIRMVAYAIAEDFIELVGPNVVTGHEHVVPEDTIDYAKLQFADESSIGGFLGYPGFGAGEEDERLKLLEPIYTEGDSDIKIPGINAHPLSRQVEWFTPEDIIAAGIGDQPGTSVLGNATGSDAPAAPITASTDDRVFARASGGLGFFQISTAMLADDAITAAKLADTSVTPGSYGAGTLVPSLTVDAQGRLTSAGSFSPVVAGDGSGTLASMTVVAVQGVPWSSSAPTLRDFAVFNGSGWVASQVLSNPGDIFVRTDVQTGALPAGTSGLPLITRGNTLGPEWSDQLEGDFFIDGSVSVPAGFGFWYLVGDIAGDYGYFNIVGTTVSTYVGGTAGSHYAWQMTTAEDWTGRLFAGAATCSYDSATSTYVWTFAAASTMKSLGDSIISGSGKKLGFFNNAGTTKISVADPVALTVSGTAGATYNATVQGIINALIVDLTAVRTKLAELIDADQSYNLH